MIFTTSKPNHLHTCAFHNTHIDSLHLLPFSNCNPSLTRKRSSECTLPVEVERKQTQDNNDTKRFKPIDNVTCTFSEIYALQCSVNDLQRYTHQNSVEDCIRCLKHLKDLATDRMQLRNEFVKSGGMDSVSKLLLHENSDVVLDTIDLLIEFTEEEE